jgi:hypothetical protein
MGLANKMLFLTFMAFASVSLVASQPPPDDDCPFTPGLKNIFSLP